jgi:hypothetical protein
LHSCIWELFFTWILVVLFCRWCRALLPHLEETTILGHFISVVSSRCPYLRGQRFFSLRWGKYPIHVFRGIFASRKENFGSICLGGACIHAFGSSFSPEF